MDEALSRQELMRSGGRIHHFDLLRGFFVLLALYQHYGAYHMHWLVAYFRESGEALTEYYHSYAPFIGVRLPMDNIGYFIAPLLIPWVSQVYITLAAFNLSRRSHSDFAPFLTQKLKTFGMLFGFFWLENFVVAANFGQALSFYPIMAWMVILSFLAIVYRYFGVKAIALCFVLSFVRFLTPYDWNFSDQFAVWVQYWIHPSFEYDARLEYFFSSATLGFLLGHTYYHRELGKKFHLPGIGIGLVMMLIWFIWGSPILVDRFDVYGTEHALVHSITGMSFLLGIQMAVILAFLWLEERGLILKIPPLSWIGHQSLFVFGFHRIFYVHIAGPIAVFIMSVWLNREPYPSSYYVWIVIVCYLILCRFVERTKFLNHIIR